jgi:hypothetical protein
MIRSGGRLRVLSCALTALAAGVHLAAHARGDDDISLPSDRIVFLQPLPIEDLRSIADEAAVDAEEPIAEPLFEELPPGALDGEMVVEDPWYWQMLPIGIIYHSYWAGAHEPRISIDSFYEHSGRAIWDATIGGRGGVIRYGNNDPLRPQGFQVDVYGAAVARLDFEHAQDLDATDYVFGFPLAYGIENTQYKFGYAHLSSHLGDELAIREPQLLEERVNYVRDSLVLGISHYPVPSLRLYSEAGYAFHNSGGAEPWEFQFGNELSEPGPTGFHGSPFLAMNGRLREEHNFGGDFTAQSGWMWRGIDGKVFRLGGHYYVGQSSQFQFYDKFEEQIGIGLWYDF